MKMDGGNEKDFDYLLDDEEVNESSLKTMVGMEVEVSTVENSEESFLNTPYVDDFNSPAEVTDKKQIKPPTNHKKEEIARYRPLNLPLARVKQIIKMDPDVQLAASEAVFLIAKAAELFIELLSKDSYEFTISSKKKTIQKKDVDSAIANTDMLVFLDGTLDL